jgi:hypothetical protein
MVIDMVVASTDLERTRQAQTRNPRYGRVMLRVAIAMLLCAGCKDEMSPHAYCVKRQMAWEGAFPDLPETDVQRDRFVDSCVAQSPERIARSMRCMEQFITGRKEAKEEYLAFTRCEAER